MPYISKSFTRSRFAVSYVYAIDSKQQFMHLKIRSYFARHIYANRSRDLGSPCPLCMLLILSSSSSAAYSFSFCTPYISKSFTRSRLAVSFVHCTIFCSSHSFIHLLPFCGEPRSRERFACSLVRIIGCLSVGVFVYLSVRLSVRLLAYQRVHPFESVCSFVCLSVCVFLSS